MKSLKKIGKKKNAIDFTAEVENAAVKTFLADLFSLKINSERDDSKADAQHPFGPVQ